MNYAKGYRLKDVALFLFIVSFVSASVQGGAISIYALINKLPPSPHKYYDEVSGLGFFYLLSFLKHLFFILLVVATFAYFIKSHLTKGQCIKPMLTRQAGVLNLVIGMMLLPMLIASVFSRGGWEIMLAGIKAILPMAAVIVGACLDRRDIKIISNFLDWLMYLNLIVAISQQISGMVECDTFAYGCLHIVRSTGLFVEPNTLASFALAKVLLMGVDQSSRNNFSLFTALLVVLLSGSRTMAVVFFVCLLLNSSVNKRWLRLSGIIMIPSIWYLLLIRGFDSLKEKALFFENLSVNEFWFGGGFGYGTQAHNLFKNYGADIALPPEADSQILSLIYQGGIWLVLSLVIMSIYFYLKANKQTAILLLLIFWLTATTFMTIEAWPLNILLFTSIGYAFRNGDEIKKSADEKYN